MKRSFAISFVALSTTLLLVFACLPHYHHHDGGLCFAIEPCEHAGQQKEENHDEGACDRFCISHAKYINTRSDEEITYEEPSCGSDHHNHIHLFHLHCMLIDFRIFAKGFSPAVPGHCERKLIYEQNGVNRLNGLRAPPFVLS